MDRGWSIILGIGLVILGILNINGANGSWIAWLDILGGILSFIIALGGPSTTVATTRSQQFSNAGGVLFICAGLFAMWIIGLVTGTVSTAMAWWNFGFACAYGLFAISAFGGRGRIKQAPPSAEDREKQGPRRAA